LASAAFQGASVTALFVETRLAELASSRTLAHAEKVHDVRGDHLTLAMRFHHVHQTNIGR
jgi:hypothetical protein